MRWVSYNFCDNEWWRQKKMATFERMLLARKHVIIAEKYNVIRKIGGGSFGDIFLAININDGEVNSVSYLAISIDLHSCMTTSCVKLPVYFGILYSKMAVLVYFRLEYNASQRYCSVNSKILPDLWTLKIYVIWPLRKKIPRPNGSQYVKILPLSQKVTQNCLVTLVQTLNAPKNQ